MYIEQTKLRKSLIETPDLYTNNILVDTMECTDITMGGVSVFGQKGYKQKILNTSWMLDSEYLKEEQIYSFMMVPTDYVNSKINQIVVYDDGRGSNLPSSPTYMSAQCYEDWEMTNLVDVHYSTNAIKQNGHGGECHWEFQNFTIRKNYGVIVFSLTTEYGGLQTDTNRIRSYSIKPTSNSNNRLYIGGWGTIDQSGRGEGGGVQTFTTYFSAILSIPTVGWTTHIADDTLHINDDDREALNICEEFIEDAEHITRKMQIHDQVISTLMKPQTKSSASEIGYTTWQAARVHAWNMKISTDYVGKYLSQIMIERPDPPSWESHDIIKGTRHQLFVDCISYETSQDGEVVQTVVDQFFSTNKAGYDKTSEDPETYATEAKWKFDNIEILPQYDILRFRVTTEENVAQYPTSAQEKAVYSKRLTSVPTQVSWGLIDQANKKIETETLYFKFTLNDTVDWNQFKTQTDNHISNNDIHVTADQKSKISTIDQIKTQSDNHISDGSIHMTVEERANVNHMTDLLNGTLYKTAHTLETFDPNTMSLVQGSKSDAVYFLLPASRCCNGNITRITIPYVGKDWGNNVTPPAHYLAIQFLDSNRNILGDTHYSLNMQTHDAGNGILSSGVYDFDTVVTPTGYRYIRFMCVTQITEGVTPDATAATNCIVFRIRPMLKGGSYNWGEEGCEVKGSFTSSVNNWVTSCVFDYYTTSFLFESSAIQSDKWIVKVRDTTDLTGFLGSSTTTFTVGCVAHQRYDVIVGDWTNRQISQTPYWQLEYHITFGEKVTKQYLLDNGLGDIEDGIYPVIIPK